MIKKFLKQVNYKRNGDSYINGRVVVAMRDHGRYTHLPESDTALEPY